MVITKGILKYNLANYIESDDNFDINILKDLLVKKFNEVDYSEAKEDVIPFIKNVNSLDIWNKEFFISVTEKLK